MEDPEAMFQEGWMLCDAGEPERGLVQLKRAVAKGYTVAPTLARSASFDALRDHAGFRELLEEAEAGRQQALAAFREHGGERLLGR
jgi:Tfp pilus assembly protein PilF